ncbi:glycerophosphodiester phosphodiesterase [Virgifigura deserti]|uniref:glycerophosphodiester phosphodiesterase n=1 Tax=Virgifigura deserti TaxID=2268457 RepID=UPI003CCBA719
MILHGTAAGPVNASMAETERRPDVRLPRVIGHRGAAAAAPENTLEGIQAAARLGAAWVEFDVKLTADAVPVLFHDETLERTTDGCGRVADTPFEALRGLDAGAWFGPSWKNTRVPSLEETLALLTALDLHANVEIKPCPGREAETAAITVETIRRVWPGDRPWPLLSSFAIASLAAAKQNAPEMPRGLLIWERPPDWAGLAADLACRTVHCADVHLTPDWAQEIRRGGYGLAVYTVNDPARAAELMRWGIDCIITDCPELLIPAVSVATAGIS